MQKFAGVLLGALVLLGTPAAYAQQTPAPAPAPDAQRYPGKGHGNKMMVYERLNLTSDQRTQIEQIYTSEKQKNAPLKEQMRQLRSEYQAAREANDTAKIESVRERMMVLKPQMQQARTETEQQVAAILTPEQRAQMEQLRAQKQRRGPGGPAPL
ncbi:Spy/CpxP family protein refolding chaperone [Gloeobacter violaceus]|uniref:Glr1687 protein n=1 Tax=Gloeobacter violaceus (strain ATCC 29082 / PCC 7421) TaxID=251221 RepID=Q7NJZ4_GLOVI|nr:Spy/CpxP family protein refolding chaperone [Gloeobacter violaceus]BAC89628.1 glr1687 [Gloeobacter violaceus PCC 7421]